MGTRGAARVSVSSLSQMIQGTDEEASWQHAIYHMDEPKAKYHVPVNKGREAMAYLTYLVDHYEALPSTIAFIHPHKEGWPVAWHTDSEDHSNVKSLNELRLNYVQEHGYVNLRCAHNPGCPEEVQPFRDDQGRKAERAMIDTWKFMFGDASTVPSIIAAPCCSQFAVTKNQTLARPKSDYVRFRDWLIETTLDDDTSGRTMEYLWHVFFNRDPV